MKFFYKGKELYNIKYLEADFNFFDLRANYKGEDGKEHLGNFRLKELEIEKQNDPA